MPKKWLSKRIAIFFEFMLSKQLKCIVDKMTAIDRKFELIHKQQLR